MPETPGKHLVLPPARVWGTLVMVGEKRKNHEKLVRRFSNNSRTAAPSLPLRGGRGAPVEAGSMRQPKDITAGVTPATAGGRRPNHGRQRAGAATRKRQETQGETARNARKTGQERKGKRPRTQGKTARSARKNGQQRKEKRPETQGEKARNARGSGQNWWRRAINSILGRYAPAGPERIRANYARRTRKRARTENPGH